MYRITANCAATSLGRRKRHRHDELTDDMVVDDPRAASNPEANLDSIADRGRLHEALQALPPKLRAVVVLRDIYDLPHEAIAAELGISESAAKVRLHRARRKLREDLFPLPVEGRGRDDEDARAV
jgi:RNA polymerase sigma-70 factor (ECF subfamily)